MELIEIKKNLFTTPEEYYLAFLRMQTAVVICGAPFISSLSRGKYNFLD